MPNTFLIQLRGDSFRKLIDAKTYDNIEWERNGRDKAQGRIELGDTIVSCCSGDVPNHPLSIAFRSVVEGASDDKKYVTLDTPHWFIPPLPRDKILSSSMLDNTKMDFGDAVSGFQYRSAY